MTKELCDYIKPFTCGICGKSPAFVTPIGFHSFLCDKHLSELLSKVNQCGYKLEPEG